MFTFLKKYNKWILIVGGGLLMIVFLIPQAIQGLAQVAATSGATRAYVGPEQREVTNAEWRQVQSEAQILQQMIDPQQFGLPRIDSPEHWYLLTREAEMLGLIGAPGSGGEVPQALLDGTRGGERFASEFIARLEGVRRLARQYITAAQFSDRRLQDYARRQFRAVDTTLVIIPAEADAAAAEPTEAELQAHLEQYADVDPNNPESDSIYGYRLPDRVKIEYLTVPAGGVREAVAQSEELSRIALRKHWRSNPDGNFPPVDPEAIEVPDVVRDDLVGRLTDEQMEEIERYAVTQLRGAQRALSRRGGYYELPEDWHEQRLPLPELAQRLQERFGLELPAYRSIGDRWLSAQDLRELEEVGAATTDELGPQPIGLTRLVETLKEFGGSSTIITQAGVVLPTLRDSEGNLYFVRVTDVDPARPPQSVDEVREQLVRDLKRKHRYEQLVAQASEIEQAAEQQGLLEVAMNHDAVRRSTTLSLADPNMLNIQRQLGTGFVTSLATPVPGLGPAPEVVEAIVDYAMSLPVDDVESVEITKRVTTVPAPDHLALVVARIDGQEPISEATYRTMLANDELLNQIRNEELDRAAAMREALSFDALAKRHQFEMVIIEDEDVLPMEEPETADLAGAG